MEEGKKTSGKEKASIRQFASLSSQFAGCLTPNLAKNRSTTSCTYPEWPSQPISKSLPTPNYANFDLPYANCCYVCATGGSDDVPDFENDLLIEAEILVTSCTSFNQKVKALIIGIGSAQCEILSANIDFSEAVKVKVIDLTVSNRVIMSCSAFVIGQSSVVWLCDTQVRDSCYGFGKWVDALLSSFLLDQDTFIYLLTDSPVSEFQSDFKPSAPFVRTLKTPRASGLCYSDIKSLEPPNIVSGFAAPIMAHCIYHSLPACTFVIYYENLRASPTKSDIFPVLSLILGAIGGLQPFILPDHASTKTTAQNFDQMYI
ncbi:Proteasome assembly chaperone 1 [Taenia crassiceps]|uniref:Proteasome assembly chaperone 1 n=1 Tax=Taenia crassiceps TaxID=6207 RepID=A0ABR4QRB0_9CEST